MTLYIDNIHVLTAKIIDSLDISANSTINLDIVVSINY